MEHFSERHSKLHALPHISLCGVLVFVCLYVRAGLLASRLYTSHLYHWSPNKVSAHLLSISHLYFASISSHVAQQSKRASIAYPYKVFALETSSSTLAMSH